MSELGSMLELLGETTTITLIELYGGTRLNVPREIAAQHPLRAQVGEAAALRMTRYFGGDQLKVPMARAWRAPIYRHRGLTYREIARRLGCTETAVYGYLTHAGSNSQGALPL